MIVPSLNSQKESVRESILEILGYQWPLTVKSIYHLIKNKYKLAVSYQAVHKALTELYKDNIVQKVNREYQLSPEWIKNLSEYCSKLEMTYLRMAPKVKEGIPEKITFTELFSMYIFFLQAFINHTFDRGNEQPVCFKGFYSWNPLILQERETTGLKEMMKSNKLFVITQSNTPFDKISRNLWESYGIRFKNGVPGCVTDSDVVVVGDYIINIYYPQDMIRDFTYMYDHIKNAEDINLPKIHQKFYYRNTNIKLLISQDKEIANQIRKSVLKHFRDRK